MPALRVQIPQVDLRSSSALVHHAGGTLEVEWDGTVDPDGSSVAFSRKRSLLTLRCAHAPPTVAAPDGAALRPALQSSEEPRPQVAQHLGAGYVYEIPVTDAELERLEGWFALLKETEAEGETVLETALACGVKSYLLRRGNPGYAALTF